MIKVLQGDITREDKVMDGVVGIVMFNGLKVEDSKLSKRPGSGVRLRRLGSRLDEIKYGGRNGSGAQAVLTGLTSLLTRGRSTHRVSMDGS